MKKQRIHHLQHVPFEGIGNISDWILKHNLIHTSTLLYKNEPLPNINDFDILLIMGGSMSVNDQEQISWLNDEKAFIKNAIEHNKTVIGICLGAQLVANVLGANVYKNNNKEIGFFPLIQTIIPSEERNLSNKIIQLFNNKTVFHWHGETFDLPKNTMRLASSEISLNQAFLYKENVLGPQFHLEMNEESIESITENCRKELLESEFVQSENKIKQEMTKHVTENRKMLFELLDYFL